MRMKCPKCKNIHTTVVAVCEFCGHKLSTDLITELKESKNFIIGFIVVFGALFTFAFYSNSGNKTQIANQTQSALQSTPTASPKLPTKLNRDTFITYSKDGIAKQGVFISASGADSEVFNINSRLSVSESEKLMQPGFESFREIGFKQIVISGKDGIKTINL